MRAGWEAMRLGAIIYFIPFFFVLNPALLLQGNASEILQVLSTALIGVALLSAGLQGYLLGFGRLGEGQVGLLARGAICLAGLALAVPAGGMYGINQLSLLAISVVFIVIGIGITMAQRKQLIAA
jgi:TRAP-type uncharacterized transport system fused permease subunit